MSVVGDVLFNQKNVGSKKVKNHQNNSNKISNSVLSNNMRFSRDIELVGQRENKKTSNVNSIVEMRRKSNLNFPSII